MGYRRFKSKKTILSWLNQRKVVMFSQLGFHFFYKINKGVLYAYIPSIDMWKPCPVNFMENYSDDYINEHYYAYRLKDMTWLKK